MRFDLPTMDEIQGSARASAAGVPLQLPVDDIDEDLEQPRQEFDQESLVELAATIAGRGVRQPVSVRRHPGHPGRWILNFGARRLRAARLAGECTIAAFEDATADSYDQVIENEQREGLKPRDRAVRQAPARSGREPGRHRPPPGQEPAVHHVCVRAHRCARLADGSLSNRQVPRHVRAP